jgi:anthranilate phosphoribosyltransferase
MLADVLARLAAKKDLSFDEMSSVIDRIMRGDVPEAQTALLLTSLRAKGESTAEIAGAAAAMRKHMTPIRSRHTVLIDTCGTGGDGSRTFNISTAAALVTAASGVPVAKHGNRAMSSRSGSADALAALGVNVAAPVPVVERTLDTLGICFCFAPLLHAATARVGEVRKKLGFPTIFNLLGPLTNPAGAPFQLLGVAKPEYCNVLAEALALLGTRRAVVVSGEGPLDEVTIAGDTEATVASDGMLRQFNWTPAEFGLERQSLDSLVVDGPEASAAMIRRVLAGEAGPARDIVVANAAAALWAAGRHDAVKAAAEAAQEAIDSGAAANLLQRLVKETNR